MCLTCTRGWTVLHVLWSFVYVCCGAAQLVSGIFFYISVPSLHLTSNLWIGTWDIFVGIGIGMVACFFHLSTRRQEILLYMTVSILAANAINVVMTEWCFYVTDMKEVVGAHRYTALIEYACWATRASTTLLIVTAFLDSQLAFCSIQMVPKPVKMKKPRGSGSHEQVSDIEYIIPRRKSSKSQSSSMICNAYSQSWVYETEEVKKKTSIENVVIVSDKTHLIEDRNKPIVKVEEVFCEEKPENERKLDYMKSFSRSTSPVLISSISPSSSTLSLNNPPIYECLQKLTEPEIYKSKLSRKSDEYYPQVMVRTKSPQVEKVQYASLMKELEKVIVNKKEPESNQSEYSSETSSSSKKTSSKVSKNSDAEFSKELEAALQLIQDLESPNTIETPSENKIFDSKWRESSSEDEKTLEEVPSPKSELITFKLPQKITPDNLNGKNTCIIIRRENSESQSTSGYSSPTHKTSNWSTTSSITSQNLNNNVSCTIHNTKSSAVISIHTESGIEIDSPKTKNVTLVKITGQEIAPSVNATLNTTLNSTQVSSLNSNLSFNPNLNSNLIQNSTLNSILSENSNINSILNENSTINSNLSENSTLKSNKNSNLINEKILKDREIEAEKIKKDFSNLWKVKSLLRKKKSNCKAKMCPELEGAIIKSESLAYLSENELLARHQRNKDIQRQIERRVRNQQLGTPRSESQC